MNPVPPPLFFFQTCKPPDTSHPPPRRVSCYEGARRFYFIYLFILMALASRWRHAGWNCRAFKKRRWRESRSFFISHGAEGAACANASEIISAIRYGRYVESKEKKIKRLCRVNQRIHTMTCEHQERQITGKRGPRSDVCIPPSSFLHDGFADCS